MRSPSTLRGLPSHLLLDQVAGEISDLNALIEFSNLPGNVVRLMPHRGNVHLWDITEFAAHSALHQGMSIIPIIRAARRCRAGDLGEDAVVQFERVALGDRNGEGSAVRFDLTRREFAPYVQLHQCFLAQVRVEFLMIP